MKKYIGTKIINAKPMTRQEYNDFRGWELPENEAGMGGDAGYLVEYTDGGKPNHPDFSGYVSWSPAPQFEAAYRETSGLTFGQALEALKNGQKLARAGWNGKDMWLSLSCSGTRSVPAENFWSPANRQYAESIGGEALVQPCITMKAANGSIQMGWAATQSDMLSEDWLVVV